MVIHEVVRTYDNRIKSNQSINANWIDVKENILLFWKKVFVCCFDFALKSKLMLYHIRTKLKQMTNN